MFEFCYLYLIFLKIVANVSLPKYRDRSRKNPSCYSNIRKLFNLALRQTRDCIAVRNPGPDVISLNAYL